MDRVLVIDDEPSDLELIARYLSSEPLVLDLESDTEAAWNKLESADTHYSLVIIDRQMPGIDGLDFLRRMKAHPRFAEVPVIMQTLTASPEKVSEGLQAGAYYYLFKPYQPEALISIVRGAIEDHRTPHVVRHLSRHQEAAHKLLLSVEYRFSCLRDIHHLVPILASFTRSPRLTASGLADLMLNAVEHGNLGITYQEKSQLKFNGTWEAEIERRLALPQYSQRFATVRAEPAGKLIRYTITDQGEGFDWQRYLEFDPSRVTHPNGRGIALARKMCFSQLEFLGKGNIVLASAASS